MLKYIFLIFLFSQNLFPQKSDESRLEEGIEFSYNLDFQNSGDIYHSLINKNPNLPDAYHYLSRDHLYRFLGSGEEEDYNSFLNYSDEAVERSEKLLDKNAKDLSARFILGSAQFLRTIAHSYKGENLDAFWSAKNAKGNLEEVVDENPDFYDAYLGIGALKYALSEISGIATLALKLTRLSGNKAEGLELVKRSFEKGERLKPEAAFQLSKIYNDYLAYYDEAASVLEPYLKKYPENVLFLYQYAIAQINARKLPKAEEILERIIQIENPGFKQTTSFSFFLLGDVHFKNNNFEKAISFYKKFLQTSNELSYTGIANLRIAISYYFLDDELEAKKHLLAARNGNPDIKEDEFAKERSKILFRNSLSEDEKKLIFNKHNNEAGKYEETVENLSNEKFFTNDLELERKSVLTEALFHLGEYQQALEISEEIIQNKNEDSRAFVFAKYIAAQIYFRQDDIKKASELLEDIEIKEEFDQSEKLKAMVEGLRRKIGKMPNEN